MGINTAFDTYLTVHRRRKGNRYGAGRLRGRVFCVCQVRLAFDRHIGIGTTFFCRWLHHDETCLGMNA